MKQAYLLTILGILFLAYAPSARAQNRPETPAAAEEEEQVQEAQQQDQAQQQGTQQQGAETPAEEEEDRGPKRIWRNSSFMVDQSASVWTLTHEGRTYNPTAFLLLRFSPRLYLADNIQLKFSQTMYLEETQSDATTYNLQPNLWDLYVDLLFTEVVKTGDFSLNTGGRILVPWSIASQANRNILGTGLTASASYAFPHVMEGFNIAFDLTGMYYISDTNVAHLEQPIACNLASPASAGDPTSALVGAPGGLCNSVAGPSTTMFYMLGGPTFTLKPTKQLSVSLSLLFWNSLGRPLADATLGTGTIATAPPGGVVIPDGSSSHWRNLEVLYFSVGYDVTTWLNLALNYYAFTSFLDPQGNWRVPLVGPDQSVSITAFFTLDQLYNAITGETHDPTRNQHQNARARAASLGGMF